MIDGRPLLLAPAFVLDRVRARLLEWFGRPLAPLFRDRELRVAWVGAVSVSFAILLTIVAPGFLLTWGPIVLGVPHLVADGRYLVARRGLIARPFGLALVLLPAAGAWMGGGAAMGALAIVAAGVVARASGAARAAIVAIGIVLALAAWRLGRTADLAVAHLHNVVAVAVWLLWPWLLGHRRKRDAHHAVVLFVFFGAAVIASGVVDRWAFPALLSSPAVNGLVAQVGVGTDPTWAVRSTLLFAFAQSVHYGVWLRLMPEEDRERTAPRPFVRSIEALARDLGWPVVALVSAASLGVIAHGLMDAVAARDGYLRLAAFHGPMELGLVALLVAERT